MTMRPYQLKAVEMAAKAFGAEDRKHPLLALPTGAGKTHVIAGIIERALGIGIEHVLILSHVKEILRQNRDRIEQTTGRGVSLYSAGLEVKQIDKITVAGIQSAWRVPEAFSQFQVVIIDEAHTLSPRAESMYKKFLAHLPDATRIGLTATPFRLKEGYIYGPGMMFDHLAYDLTSADNFNRLIEDGYLSDLTVKATAQKLSVEGVKTIGGDFNEKQLSAENDREEVTNACVQEIIAKGADRKKWLVFAIDIQHAQHVSDAMNACGIKTALLHSKMREDRDMLIRRFRDGEYRCLVNINILTTGFDVPDIDLVALLRPTKSPVLHVQTIGRGMRVAVGKSDCLILDFAGNISRLGPINRVHVRKKGKGGKGGVMAKECPQCAELVHLSVKVCPKCEHKFVFKEKLTPKADLQEVIARKDRPRWFVVVDVKYRVIEKYKSPPMLMVTYLTAEGDKIREWCCIEHQNFAGVKAKQWMAKRGVDFHYTEEAFAHRGMIPKPKKILVDLSGRYPDIKETIFSRNSVQLALSQEA